MRTKEKKVIGWKELINLPEWGIQDLLAKVDTGARTSSLHVEDVVELPQGRISFYVVLSVRPKKRRQVTARAIKMGSVKSSIGHKTNRWFVRTKFGLGPAQKDIVINLVGREDMNFRMLIGRKAIEREYLVDAGRSFLVKPQKKQKKAKA